MSDVPSEIYREILVLLPAESLLRLRSVCKTWLCIIDDPSFIKAHTNQLYSHTLTILLQTETLYSFSLDSLNFMINGPQMIDATRIENLVCRDVPRVMNLFSMASCHGLILLSDDTGIWVIQNPLTKECRKLPKPDAAVATFGFGYGIGYDSDSDDYKVVRIDHKLQTLIYSLKSDSWRKVEHSPCEIAHNGVFLDGVLYWPSHRAIIALDLRTERYCQMPLPLPLGICDLFNLRLDALDGCLICTLNNDDYDDDDDEKNTLDAWVMKDNGWSKLFSLEISVSVLYPLILVAYLKRKGQVLLHHYHGFFWFDIQNNLTKSFSIHGLSNNISSSRICPGSLVRLNGSDTGLGVVLVKRTFPWSRKRVKTKTSETRLKFCVRNAGEMCCGQTGCSDYNYCSENLCSRCEEE